MNCRSTVFSIAAAFVLSASMDALGVVLDKDYAKGERTFEGGDIVDLNGHRLYIDSAELNAVKFVDLSSGKKGELHVFVDEGSNCNLGSLDVSGNLKIVKYGKGGLTVPATGVELKCAEGRLGVGGKLPIHRWSFTDGSLVDSVGGVEAVQVGSASLENNAVTFPGGVNGSCYLDLGKDVLPSTGDATIELWGRRNEAKHQWASMFSIGVNGNNANSLRMAWSNHDAGDGKTDMVYLKKNGGNVFFISNTMSPYVVGTMYHISMRFKQKSDGSTEITWAKRNVETGAIEKTHTEVVSKDIWSLAEYAGNPLVLNHGYDNDDEAATYDEVRIWDCALSDEELTGNAKAGPDAYSPKGVLKVLSAVDAPELAHRWSFTDGSLVDSVGGGEAVQVGSASLENNAVTFPGGVNGSCYLDLGKDVLPSTGDATIELWGRRNEAKHQWASMFSIGVNGNNANSLRMAWSNHDAGDGKTDMVYLKKNGGNVFFISNTMSPYVVGTMYHISMRFKQKSDGSTEITWAKRNVETGAIEKTHTEVVSKDIWSLAEYAGNPLVLNHGYDNDDEAATYDEVRIWKGALTDDQLSLNAKLGPDKTIAHPSSGRCGIVEVSEGAVLATPDTGVDCERLTGAGTLEAPSSLTVGTLDIAGDGFGTFTVDGYLKVAGDWLFGAGAGSVDRIVGAGTLDLSEANLEPSFTQDAFGSNLMASGVAVSGYEQMTLPDGMDIKYKSGNLRLISSGFMILIK